MADDKVLGILMRVQGAQQASSQIKGVSSAVGGLHGGLSNLAANLKTDLGNALSTFGGRLKQIATLGVGALGIGGVLGGASFLSDALTKTSEFSLALEKMTGLTGESAQSMGQLIMLFDHYGIAADQASTLVGFAEKTIGKLNETSTKAAKAGASAALLSLEHTKLLREENGLSTKHIDLLIKEQKARDALNATDTKAVATGTKLTALEKQFGINLHNADGSVVNYSTELSRVADFYNSNATASQKATLAATLFGRGYATLIPILQLGSKGIADQEQAYKDLGLTLGLNTQDTLTAYQSALRNVGEAVNVLQLELGLKLAPMVTKAANAFTLFLEHGGAEQVISGFESIVGVLETAGSAVVDLASKAIGFWNSIPSGLRDLLVKGFVADRALSFFFGVSPIKIVASLAQDALGGVSKSVASGLSQTLLGGVQKVWVVNPGFGGGGGPAGEVPAVGEGVVAAGGADVVAEGAATVGIGTMAGVLAAPLALALAPYLVAAALPRNPANFTGASTPLSHSFGAGPVPVVVTNGAKAGGLSPEDRALNEPLIAANSKLQAIKDAAQTTAAQAHRDAANAAADQARMRSTAIYQTQVLQAIADKKQDINLATHVSVNVAVSDIVRVGTNRTVVGSTRAKQGAIAYTQGAVGLA